MPQTLTRTFTIPGLSLAEPLRPIGDDCGGDLYARLLGRLDLLGASFHVEADQVQMVDEDNEPDINGDTQDSVLPGDHCHYPELVNLAGGGEPFETIEIPGLTGRRYVLYIYPYGT